MLLETFVLLTGHLHLTGCRYDTHMMVLEPTVKLQEYFDDTLLTAFTHLLTLPY